MASAAQTALALCALVASLLSGADAHANIMSVRGSSGSAGPMGSNSFRAGIPRGDTGIPGPPQNFNCPHCVMENRPTNGQTNNQGYTRNAGAHWDNGNQWPSIPCMSNDRYGQRGTLNVRAGETLDVEMYINADHGGFYRFELANGTSPSNSQFMSRPISTFYSFHENAETSRTYPGRVVGWSKADTNAYINSMTGWPGAALGNQRLNPTSQGASSTFCRQNRHRCFFNDRVTIPSDSPNGQAVLRWNWFSLETSQVYTNCIDVNISGGGGNPGPSPTPAPPPPPSGGCSGCYNDWPNSCGYWCGRAWNEGCSAVGCSRNECDFC